MGRPERVVFVRGMVKRRYDNGNVRVSFAPYGKDCPEFPLFEMNIPEQAIVDLKSDEAVEMVNEILKKRMFSSELAKAILNALAGEK